MINAGSLSLDNMTDVKFTSWDIFWEFTKVLLYVLVVFSYGFNFLRMINNGHYCMYPVLIHIAVRDRYLGSPYSEGGFQIPIIHHYRTPHQQIHGCDD